MYRKYRRSFWFMLLGVILTGNAILGTQAYAVAQPCWCLLGKCKEGRPEKNECVYRENQRGNTCTTVCKYAAHGEGKKWEGDPDHTHNKQQCEVRIDSFNPCEMSIKNK